MKKSGILYRSLYAFAAILWVFLFIPSIGAQVNQSEMDNLGPVEFINYEGPYSRIETRAQIRGIGYDLGLAIKRENARAGGLGRYFVIHSVSGPDGAKLDADIFGLGADVGVDHIRNLRLIIQGYLEAAYEYTEKDAALLAEYITVYNAVYRGDMGYFRTRYKNPVITNLSQEKAGLAIRFDEWPGQTLMLIPLGTGLGGQLSSIDTTPITDSRVLEQLRQEPDMSLEQRRDMVEFLEREADQARQEAEITREAIREEEQQIAQERQQAQEQQRQAQETQRQVAQERQQAQQPQQPAEQRAQDRREQEAQRQEQEARQQLEELEKREEALEELKELAEAQEAFAEQKSEEAQEQRQEIAGDQQVLIDQPRPEQDGILGVSILNPDSALGRFVLLDDSGRAIKQSPLNTVNAKTVTRLNNRIYAIAGVAQGSGAIRLVEVDGTTLEMLKQGDDNIAPQSLLWVNGQNIYAITGAGSNFNLAMFNTDLVLQARSSISVHPFASVLFAGGFIITQRADGSAALLEPVDLSERR